MKNDLITLRDRLRASYWFIPALMAVLALILSVVAIEVDKLWGREVSWVIGLVYVDSPEGARSVLSTVASSMITVAGTVFSLTMVVLSLTSQQYGPLVLSNFLRDRGNQFVLGTFTATFIYCLLILRTIRGGEDDRYFVPQIAVLIGLGMAIFSLAVLIYFIHHVSDSIRASTIIVRISNDLYDAIDNLYPEVIGRDVDEVEVQHHDLPITGSGQAKTISMKDGGYLQLVDDGQLMSTAVDNDLVIKLAHRPGVFMLSGAVAATVWPPERVDEKVEERITNALELGSSRTQEQDIEYLLNQLVSIAVRALSPSLNDPFTAMSCIDRLGEALCRIGNRDMPSAYRYDDEGELRVIANPLTFAEVVHIAFDEIWAYGRQDYQVRLELQKIGDMLSQCLKREDHRAILRRYIAQHPLHIPEDAEVNTPIS